MTADPRCPACDEPVGTTASYCIHCDAEFDSPVEGDRSRTATAGDTQEDAGTSVPSVSPDLTAWERRLADWLGPNGWIDNSLTIVVAIGAGIVIGPLTATVLGLLTASLWSVAVGVIVWLVSTASLANRRTVYGAVRGSCFAIAGLLVVLPGGFLFWVSEQPLTRLGVFLAFELLVGVVVVPLLVLGFLAGRLRTKFDA